MIVYIISNCNYKYCISDIKYCYYTYLSKTKNRIHDDFKYRSGDIHYMQR